MCTRSGHPSRVVVVAMVSCGHTNRQDWMSTMRQELERQAHVDISTCQLPTLWSVHQRPAGQPNWIAVETSRLRVLTLDESRGDSRQAKSPVFDSYGLLLSNKFGMGSWSEDGDNVQGDARAKNLSLKGVLYRFSE